MFEEDNRMEWNTQQLIFGQKRKGRNLIEAKERKVMARQKFLVAHESL